MNLWKFRQWCKKKKRMVKIFKPTNPATSQLQHRVMKVEILVGERQLNLGITEERERERQNRLFSKKLRTWRQWQIKTRKKKQLSLSLSLSDYFEFTKIFSRFQMGFKEKDLWFSLACSFLLAHTRTMRIWTSARIFRCCFLFLVCFVFSLFFLKASSSLWSL